MGLFDVERIRVAQERRQVEERNFQIRQQQYLYNYVRLRAEEGNRLARNIRIKEQEKQRIISSLKEANKRFSSPGTKIILHSDLMLVRYHWATWWSLIKQMDVASTQILLNNLNLFTRDIQERLQPLLPVLSIKVFSFQSELITRSEIARFLSHIKGNDTIFFTTLKQFFTKLATEVLSDLQIFCLQRIVKDYEIGLLGSRNPINDIMVQKLLRTTTLNQLSSKEDITSSLDIHHEQFKEYLNEFRQRVTSLPLSAENKECLDTTIFPGIEHLIEYEDDIIEHVTKHHGELYYLSEKLPLHTDHIKSGNPEEYRHTLHRLLINFFGAANIAYSKGRLNIFCEKICLGYCFEGRVDDTFNWVISLSNIKNFDATMEDFYQKEYIPYARVMLHQVSEDATPIVDFIMLRHKNAECLKDENYAPDGKITRTGLKKYLVNILSLDCAELTNTLASIRELQRQLIREKNFLFTSRWLQYKQIKIDALTELHSQIQNFNPPIEATRRVRRNFPLAERNMFYNSRTRKLLRTIENSEAEAERLLTVR